jgi:hypothetical protein
MADIRQPKTIFEQMLQGEQINNEILVGIASEMDAIKQQLQVIIGVLYAPVTEDNNTSEPTALGAEDNE